jgi:hypothetical protein
MDNVNEKWSGDTEIKSTGKWADKTIAELKKARSALKDKEDRTKEETSKLRQINFAIRSKKDWKGGVDEGDGSGSYGGQSPLSYDTQRSSKMKEDEELNEFKTVKTAVGLFPTNDQGGPLSGEEYHVWTMQTDKNPPKERIISQRYQMYLQDFKDYVKTESIHEADDELNEIKRLSGLEEAFAWDEIDEAKRKARTDVDDFDDDEEDEQPEDPEKDKVQHILMQVRKAIDVDGDYAIKFADGASHSFPTKDLEDFITMYMGLRPLDREKLQQVAIMSKGQFEKILSFFQPDHPLHQKSIYEK